MSAENGSRSGSAADAHDVGENETPAERLRRIFAADTSVARKKTLGKRSCVTEAELIAAVGSGDQEQVLASINVCCPPAVEITTEGLLDFLEGYHDEDTFLASVSLACQDPSVSPPTLQNHVYLARPRLLAQMALKYRALREDGVTIGDSFEGGSHVGSTRRLAGGMLFNSTVAVFPFPALPDHLPEDERFWCLILVFGLRELEESVKDEEDVKVTMCLLKVVADPRGFEGFGLVAEGNGEGEGNGESDGNGEECNGDGMSDDDNEGEGDVEGHGDGEGFSESDGEGEGEGEGLFRVLVGLIIRFIGRSYVNEFRAQLPENIEYAVRVRQMRTSKEDADGGALMAKMVEVAVETGVECIERWRDDPVVKNWDGANFGDKSRWWRSILNFRKTTTTFILENVRDTFASRRTARRSSRSLGGGGDDRRRGQAATRPSSSRRNTAAPAASLGESSTNPAASQDVEGSQAIDGNVSDDAGDDSGDEEEEELEIEREWVEVGVPVEGGSEMPEGEPLPAEILDAGTADAAAPDPFAKVGIRDFVSIALGMGDGWQGGRDEVKRAFTPTRRLDLQRSVEDVSERNLIMSVDVDALRMCCTFPSFASTINSTAGVLLLKHPVLGTGMIKGGMFSFPVAGESRDVKVQNIPNIRVGTVRGDHRLGDLAVNLLFMYTWYDLDDDERQRDVFRPASKKHLEAYMTALSSTMTLLEDHRDLLHLNGGVAPTLAQMKLAQGGEMWALPLRQEARQRFFETLVAQLHSACGVGLDEERAQFLLVLKGIGQKNMMRHQIFKEGEAEQEYKPLLEWELNEEGGSGGMPKPECTRVNVRSAEFAGHLRDALGTVVGDEAEGSLSIDIGVEIQASTSDGDEPLVLLPKIEWWGGEGRGASYRSSADPSRRGHLGDKRMDNIDRYSCLGTDQGGSLAARSSSGGEPVLEPRVDANDDAAYDETGAMRQAAKVYSPPAYHYSHTAAGPVMARSLRNSPFTSLVEMIRIAGLGGGRVGSKRFNSISAKLREVRDLATSVLSGLGSRSGSMRVEVSYSVPAGGSLGDALQAAARDILRQVVGYDDRGWCSLQESFYAIPAKDVALLAKAGIERSVAAIQGGLDASGKSVGEALPMGLLPSVGENMLQLGGKVFRRVVLGRMLLGGLRHFGYVGLLEGDLDSLSVPGADSSTSSPLPPGLLVGCGGGRKKEGFTPTVRPFLREFGLRLPRVGGAGELLADTGKKLHDLLGKVVELLLKEMQRLLRRNKMLPPAEGASGSSVWHPGVRNVKEANEALASAESSTRRRFQVAGPESVAAGVHLRKIVTPIVDKDIDRLPTPAATLFSSLVHVLSVGGGVTRDDVTRWLELLLEAVYVEEQELALVPEAHATRMFRVMGCFVKCDYRDAKRNLENFIAKYPDVDFGGMVQDVTVLLALCVDVDPKCSILSVYQARQRTDVTGRTNGTRDAFNRFKDCARETLDHIGFGYFEDGEVDAALLYERAFRSADATIKAKIAFHRPHDTRLPQIMGRYGMTTAQVLAAACAVMDGALAPSSDERVSVVVRGRLEGGSGGAAAASFDRATNNPAGVITRAVYPVTRNPNTPLEVFRSWRDLRGGSSIEQASLEQNLQRCQRASRRTRQDIGVFSSRPPSPDHGEDPDNGREESAAGEEPHEGELYGADGGFLLGHDEGQEPLQLGQNRIDDPDRDEDMDMDEVPENIMCTQVSFSALCFVGRTCSGREEFTAGEETHEGGLNDADGGYLFGDDEDQESRQPGQNRIDGSDEDDDMDIDEQPEDNGREGFTAWEEPHEGELHGVDGGNLLEGAGVQDVGGGQGELQRAAGGGNLGGGGVLSAEEETQRGAEFNHDCRNDGEGIGFVGMGANPGKADLAGDPTGEELGGGAAKLADLGHHLNDGRLRGAVVGASTQPSTAEHAQGGGSTQLEFHESPGDDGDDEALSEFERLGIGQRSILKPDACVGDVVSEFKTKKQLCWFRQMCQHGLSGSEISKSLKTLRCAKCRSSSVVKSVEELEKQFEEEDTDMRATGNAIIARLMSILVEASILTGPHGKGRFRPGDRLLN
eukprot:g14928.t3